MRCLPLLLAAVVLFGCAATLGAGAGTGGEPGTAAYFDTIRNNPPLLRAFVQAMPKGGDLHNHLSGAIYAESYIAWAAQDGLCIDRAALALVPPPCAAPSRPPASEAYRDGTLYSAVIDALSMRDFVPGPQSGHDHFFATFAKFGGADARRGGDMLAEAAARAGAENVSYLELMTSPGMAAARKLGAALGWDDDLARLAGRIRAAGLAQIVADTRRELDAGEQAMRQRLGCANAAPPPGCAVTIRYLAQAVRTFPPEQVFAEFVFAFALVEADPRVVGFNLVAPEDDPVSLRDYAVQMRMLGFLHREAPAVPFSLHAGELTLGLVPPEALRFHIRSAVEVAGARRIGHGVDLLYEDDPWALLREMAQRHVLVEINLSSNDLILGVRGDRHPLQVYRRFGVPVTLSTDDEGVSRIDLSNEYERAALTYGLGYFELKGFARNSLEYAFLPGASLWHSLATFAPVEPCATGPLGAAEPEPACRAFLAGSEKARAQWRLEGEFGRFEATPWQGR